MNENIQIKHGDSLQAMRAMPENRFDWAIVDPPYGINAGKMTMGSGKHKFSKDKDWDSAIPSAEYFAELFRVSKNQIVWGVTILLNIYHQHHIGLYGIKKIQT